MGADVTKLQSEIADLKTTFENELALVSDLPSLDALYTKYLSKKSGLTTLLLKKLPELDQDAKKLYGPALNSLQHEQLTKIDTRRAELERQVVSDAVIDLTIPHLPAKIGHLHPLTQITRKLNDFFRYYGFSIVEGPEIETVEYNFRKLNLPEGHPATDLQDTLFVKTGLGDNDVLLRTHTSSIEARVLSDNKPPIRVAFPGKCYRNETINATNSPFFNQYQGVVVDEGITIQNLMHILERAHKFLFGEDTELRFRYKYYPEVSPGLGVDMRCKFCGGTGCEVCKGRGWIEMLGSGMIHYNTLKMCGIDPEVYTGYAFGMGLDRFAMQASNISDIRVLYGGGMVYI